MSDKVQLLNIHGFNVPGIVTIDNCFFDLYRVIAGEHLVDSKSIIVSGGHFLDLRSLVELVVWIDRGV